MERIGLYNQTTPFSTKNAGSAEWCKGERDGKEWFIKKFHSPVYPSKEIGLPEKMYEAGVREFHEAMAARKEIYRRLREQDHTGLLVIPKEVISYRFHICTVTEFVYSNFSPKDVCRLSEWQRFVLLRSLTLALMQVHQAGVVHSDMKPDNVLLRQDAEGNCFFRLIDFDGSFLEEQPPLDPEEVAGDPVFFAPEAYRQFMGEDIRLDHRIDIFALGIIFHFLWCGHYPQKPDGQNIGECLVLGGEVVPEASLPPVLAQLIKRMITSNPDDRLTLKQIYDVLGVQVANCPAEIVCLQDTTGAEARTEKIREGNDEAADPDGTIDSTRPVKEIRIKCCDEIGMVLKERTLKIPFGEKQYVTAEDIPGYEVAGKRSTTIEVSEKGYAPSQYIFTYRKPEQEEKKKGKWKKILGWLLPCVIIFYLIVTGSVAENHLQAGRYEYALDCMNAFPFYQEIYPEKYNRAREGYKEQIYQEGVRQYRRGSYYNARNEFNQLADYKDNRLYLIFCNAHTGSPQDYYDRIIKNIDFEDAKELLCANSDIFEKFMRGDWSCMIDGKERIITMDEKGTVSNMPEYKGKGSWGVKKGVYKKYYEGDAAPTDQFKILILNKDWMQLTSVETGRGYQLYRK